MQELETERRPKALTRALHWGISFSVVAQMLLGTFMEHPRRDRPGDFLFEVHEKLGLVILALLIVYWIWAMVRSGEKSFGLFFPWFSGQRLRDLGADIKRHAAAIARGTLPPAEDLPLASAIHGLGIICATGLAVTGSVGYFIPAGRAFLGYHELFVTPMWIYLGGHVVMTILHELKGERLLAKMFLGR